MSLPGALEGYTIKV